MTTRAEISARAKERCLKALAMRRDGKKFREIADAMGVCVEVARQAVKKGERVERKMTGSPSGAVAEQQPSEPKA